MTNQTGRRTGVTNQTGRRGQNQNLVFTPYTRNIRRRQPCLQEPDLAGEPDLADDLDQRAVFVERPRQRRHREAVAKMVRSRPTGHMPRHKRHKGHRDRRYKFDDFDEFDEFDDLVAERPRQRRYRQPTAEVERSRPAGHVPRHKGGKGHGDRRYNVYDDFVVECPRRRRYSRQRLRGDIRRAKGTAKVFSLALKPVLNWANVSSRT